MLDLEKAGENQIPRVAKESGNMAFVAAALLLEIVSAQNFEVFFSQKISIIVSQSLHIANIFSSSLHRLSYMLVCANRQYASSRQDGA